MAASPISAQVPEESEFARLPPLHPPRAPLPPGYWEQHRTGILVGTGLLLAGAVGLIWYIRRPLPTMMIPPVVQAQREIEAIAQEDEPGRMLSLLSRCLRRYLTQAFGLPEQEATTREFISLVHACPELEPDQARTISGFLRACDERKFSPEPPNQPAEPISVALQIINEAEQRRTAKAASRTTRS